MPLPASVDADQVSECEGSEVLLHVDRIGGAGVGYPTNADAVDLIPQPTFHSSTRRRVEPAGKVPHPVRVEPPPQPSLTALPLQLREPVVVTSLSNYMFHGSAKARGSLFTSR